MLKSADRFTTFNFIDVERFSMDSRKRFKTVVWTPIDWCVFDDNEDSYFWKRIYLCGQDLSPLSLPAPVQQY